MVLIFFSFSQKIGLFEVWLYLGQALLLLCLFVSEVLEDVERRAKVEGGGGGGGKREGGSGQGLITPRNYREKNKQYDCFKN